jgi:hypothetical protein
MNATTVATSPCGRSNPSVKSDEPASLNARDTPFPSTARKIIVNAAISIASHTTTIAMSTTGA